MRRSRIYRSKEPSVKRDIALLLIGAMISFITSFSTNCLNNQHAEKMEKINRKIKLNEDLANDLGQRLYATEEFFKQKKGALDNHGDSLYYNAKYKWNQRMYSYRSLIKFYYGNETLKRYETEVFAPLCLLGKNVENIQDAPTNKAFKNYFWTEDHNMNKKESDFIQLLFTKIN